MKKTQIFLTCEHGGAEIPAEFRSLFIKDENVLKTHRALDIGALEVATLLKKNLKVPLLFSTISRLIVDLNRLLDSSTLFSEFIKSYSANEKKQILQQYYHPHRNAFRKAVVQSEKKDQLLIHIGVHSFTPKLNGRQRKMQIALLYDPRRGPEKKFADLWMKNLKKQFPEYNLARNKPYKGAGYGINDFFRRMFSKDHYIGIEIEMGQALLVELQKKRQTINFAKKLSASLREADNQFKKLV